MPAAIETLPPARPPKRLFRLGPLGDPVALPTAAPDGPWDDPRGVRALHLFGTRRGALLDALAGGEVGVPPGVAVAPTRIDDPRPFLDLRDPARLPPGTAALLDRGDAPSRAALLALADDQGFAGIVAALPTAPTQACWVLLDPDAARLLAPPSPLSPHDPDLVAVRRLLGR